jgi:hypothetical protein
MSRSWRHTSALLIVSVCHRMIFARSRYCAGLVLSASGLSAILLIGGRRSCSATPPRRTKRAFRLPPPRRVGGRTADRRSVKRDLAAGRAGVTIYDRRRYRASFRGSWQAAYWRALTNSVARSSALLSNSAEFLASFACSRYFSADGWSAASSLVIMVRAAFLGHAAATAAREALNKLESAGCHDVVGAFRRHRRF